MGITLAIVAVGLGCFGAGVVWNKQAVNAANEAKLDAQKAFCDAKNEFQKMKNGLQHRLDQILG